MEHGKLLEQQADLRQVIDHDEDLRSQCYTNFDDEGETMLLICINNNKTHLRMIERMLAEDETEQVRSPDEEDPNRGNKS